MGRTRDERSGVSVFEVLEPRLMLSGTSCIAGSQIDLVDGNSLEQSGTQLLPNPGPAAAPDGQVNTLRYHRTIDLDAGLPGSSYEIDVDLESSLVDDVILHMPWGETTVLSNYLPVGWAGEYFETSLSQGQAWIEILVEPLGTSSDPILDTYYCEWDYSIDSTAVEAEALWQAVDVIPLEVIVEFPVGDSWSTLLDFDAVPMPDALPQLDQPLPFEVVDSLRPTFEWSPWIAAPPTGMVDLWIEAQGADDWHGHSWPADLAVSDWTPDRDLLPGQPYEYALEFFNRVTDSSSGVFLDTSSVRQMQQALTVDITPGGNVDPRSDIMQANAATVHAGDFISGAIGMTNAGSDPVSFPWVVLLSPDAAPDASDRVIGSEVWGLAPGQTMGGEGQVYIPPDVAPGTYHVILVVDPDDLVSESDETNNIAVSDPFTVTVPANFEPIAILDVFQCDENDSLTVSFADLTANDIDYDSDPFSVVAVTEIGQTHGTLQVVGDQITYTPDVNYHGPARFEYTIRDSAALEATTVVNISVEELPDGQVTSVMYDRAIEWTPGIPNPSHELGIDFETSLVDDITIFLPWGETTVISDYLPPGWAGESFDTEIQDGSWLMEIDVESLGTNADPQLDTYRYAFDYELETTAVEFDAWWQAVGTIPTATIVEFPVANDWSTLLNFDTAPMPDATPEVLQPLPFADVSSLRPTFEWTPWSTDSEIGAVSLWLDASFADDGLGGWWSANPAVSSWIPDRDLLAGEVYEYWLEFCNQTFDSSSGTSVSIRSGMRRQQSLVVAVPPGGDIDLRADAVRGDSPTVEAGGSIPGWIEITNAGSYPVSYPWKIVLSSDTVPDAPDVPIISSTMELPAGEGMGGGGQVHIPADVPAGTYCMILVLDPDDLVTESDETNNIAVSDPFTVTVPVNFKPIAVLDVFQCYSSDSLIVSFADITANDIDYDSDPFSVVAVTEIGQTHGTLQVVGDQITYTPDVNYHGPARFEYTIRDSAALEATSVVNISVVRLPDGQVNYLTYDRAIDWNAGLPVPNYDLRLDFEASPADEITIRLPWGETTVISDYLPLDWAGEPFEIQADQGLWYADISVEPRGTNADPMLDTYRYEFEYGLESTAVEFDAWWRAVRVIPTEVVVEFPAGNNWSTLLDFNGVPIPDATPEFVQPPPFANVNSLRPTIEWTPWTTGPESGGISFWLDAEFADDGVGDWWPANSLASSWTPDRDLLAGELYEYQLEFYNQISDFSSGTSVNSRFVMRRRQSLTVDVAPGGDVDLRADSIQGNAPTAEAGGYIPGWIEITNAGSYPVSFPWKIVLSSDTTPDPSDHLIASPTMELGAGESISDGGDAYIPADVAAGTYHMILVLDPDNLISESDETNNIAVSDPFTVTIPANFEPIAVLDVFQCERNDSLTVSFADLTANDIDYDDDPLSVVAVTPNDQTHGTLQVVGDQITYTPDVNYHGPAKFEYTIRDSAAQEATAIVNISVEENIGSVVAGRHVFYNNSLWDGNDPAAGSSDDGAIDTSKQAVLPGGVASPENYTSYSLGINGIMIDIDSLTGTPTAGDLGIRVNETANPDTWSAGPTPTVSIRPGNGVGGSDRITLIWADGEIQNRWVEVTALANANTGLAVDDVFYFGNAVGDCDGDGGIGSSDYETLVGEFGQRGGIGTLVADLNGDGRAELSDFAIMRGAKGNSVLAPTFPAAAPGPVVESALDALAVAAAVTSVNPGTASDQLAVSSDQLTANGNGVAPRHVKAAPGRRTPNNDSAPAIDLLAKSPSPAGYISESQAISIGLSVTTLYRAATGGYDLRPLGDDLVAGQADDLLADILAESALEVPL